MSNKIYRYREGVHGEHCIVVGVMEFVMHGTIGITYTKIDAERLVAELNNNNRQNQSPPPLQTVYHMNGEPF